MTKVDFDVMINDGRTYYGRICGRLPGKLMIIDGMIKEVLTEEQVRAFVLSKMPSLKNMEFRVYNN